MADCTVCGAKALARGLCRRHYYQQYRKERFAPLDPDRSLRERVLAKVVKADNGCWLWTAGRRHDGYGMIWRGGRAVRAHRVSYELFCGPVTDDDVICHRCDVRNCINPEHLFLGTRLDNNQDKVAKGDQPHGEGHWRARFTDEDVLLIRSMRHVSDRAMAERFGVNQSTIWRIRSGNRWKHLP